MVEVGDKARVTTDEYPKSCPRGTVCTVICIEGDRILVVVDGCNGSEWFFSKDQYEPLTAEEPKTYYAEQAAKYGIMITVSAEGVSVTYDGSR